MGRNVGRHADSDTGGTVDQQVGEAGGEYAGFLPGLVEVGVPVHGVLVDVPEHFVGNFAQAGFGVTVSRGGIAVHGAEVAVAVHQQIPHGKVLRKTHHGVVNRRVAVGMVFAQHVTDAGGRLFEGLVGGQAAFVHGVQNPAVNGLQSVPDVRQCPPDNDGHGIFNIRFLHFVHQIGLCNDLVGEADILRFITAVMSHKRTSSSGLLQN